MAEGTPAATAEATQERQAPVANPDQTRQTIADGLNAVLNKPQNGGGSSSASTAQAPAPTQPAGVNETPAQPSPAPTQTQAGAAAPVEAPPASTPTPPPPASPAPTQTQPPAQQEPDYKALYLQRERERQDREARQFSEQQTQELNGRQAHINTLDAEIRELENDIAEAVNEDGYNSPRHQRLYRQQKLLEQNKSLAEYDLQTRYNQFQQSYGRMRLEQNVQNLDRTLAAEGLSFKDLMAADDKLDPTDNFAVARAAAKAKEIKLKASFEEEKKKLLEKVAEANTRAEQFRNTFDATAPGAQPDRGATGGHAPVNDALARMRSGESSLSLIEDGLRAKRGA